MTPVIPRDQALWRHITLALANSKLDRETYADDVARIYLERTPAHLRGIDVHQHVRGSDPYKVREANKQLVLRRMLDPDGPVRAPMELEEAAVLALPQPFQRECLRELAGRYGLLAAPITSAGDAAAVASSCGELAREFGECLLALAATIGDGHLDPSDAAHAPAAIRELTDLIAHATGLRSMHMAHVDAATAGHGTVAEFPLRAGKDL